jgi:NTE family protein
LYKRTNLRSHIRHIFFILALSCAFYPLLAQQKVGLVLSGGGAAAFAHIGVLKAIEERGIPIDCITGTSAGALIGAMYASGLSITEIESYITSESFQLMSQGKLKPSQHFLHKEDYKDAGLINISFAKDSILKKSLPTNFISSSFLDFEMLKLFGSVSATYNQDFDSLFVPFRCVASDIASKKTVVFSNGDLNQVVRASMTYPFYLNPIRINEVLLFDGGLYNNFPADVMYTDFNPDFIIGSNVSYNASPPQENDLISQLTNMLVSHSDYSLPCERGIIIEPVTSVTTFNFENVQTAINDGYNSALNYLDSIEMYVSKRISKEELLKKRQAFRAQIKPIYIDSITAKTPENKDVKYARRTFMKESRKTPLTLKQAERKYYRLYATPQIDFMYPTFRKNKDSTYSMNMEIRKSNEFRLDVGGHFSSRPVNTGYIGLTYRSINKTATSIKAESYFGKFYGSIRTELSIDLPSVYPVMISPYFTMNRWDYFKSFATFFEEVKPSFLIQNEIYYGINLKHPIGNTSKSIFDFRHFTNEDRYYQTKNFTNKDTSDVTRFSGQSVSWQFEQNSLNYKQFATGGHFFNFKMRYVTGEEHSVSGSNSTEPYDIQKKHHWISLNGELRSFIIDQPSFHFGLHGKAVMNTQSLFANYTASLLSMSSFEPIPDAQTFFLPEYRSPFHAGGGVNMIFTLKKKFDLRFDAYYYQPFKQLILRENGTFEYSKLFKGETVMLSSSLLYRTFIGPIRATVNYLPKQATPFFFQVSFGYVIFNERSIR